MKYIQYLFKILGISAGLLALLFVHVFLNFTLVYPWSQVNIVFAAIVLLLLNRGSGLVVWMSFSLHFMLELYAANAFGVTLFSGTLATLLLFWLYQHVFTNRSWYAALALGFFSIFLYRTLYTVLVVIVSFVNKTDTAFLRQVWPAFGWEIFLTTAVVGILYALLSRVMQSFDTDILRA